MIEINLLPGAKKAKRGGGGRGMPSINFAAIGAAISAKVKDKFLAAAVISSVVGFGAIAILFLSQRNRQSNLRAAEDKAMEDSSKYAVTLRERARAQARRDSALIQLNIIKAIDEERYIWPHVMDEVSRALPIYTWLRTVNNTSVQGVNPAAAMKTAPDTGAKAKKRRAEPVIPKDTIRLRIIGRTVDIQAFTRFMRSLEDSPFLSNITLQKSEVVLEQQHEITQFTLDATYTRPDSTLLRRLPLTLGQR